MKTSESDLALAAASGDEVAFGTLLEAQYDRIFRFAFSILGNQADAEDLTHDICLALPAKITRYDGRAAFSSWLYRVVINAARDAIRRRGTYRNAVAGWGEMQHLTRPDDTSELDLEWLAHAMGELPEALRETVALVLGEDLSHAQAAAALDISEGTVSWRMAQVRKSLAAIAHKEGLT